MNRREFVEQMMAAMLAAACGPKLLTANTEQVATEDWLSPYFFESAVIRYGLIEGGQAGYFCSPRRVAMISVCRMLYQGDTVQTTLRLEHGDPVLRRMHSHKGFHVSGRPEYRLGVDDLPSDGVSCLLTDIVLLSGKPAGFDLVLENVTSHYYEQGSRSDVDQEELPVDVISLVSSDRNGESSQTRFIRVGSEPVDAHGFWRADKRFEPYAKLTQVYFNFGIITTSIDGGPAEITSEYVADAHHLSARKPTLDVTFEVHGSVVGDPSSIVRNQF